MAYDINYDDERFTEVENDKNAALSEVDKTYGDMISKSDTYYQKQIDASKEWADKQAQLQQEQTDFAIEQIEQEKEQANKDYIKEQSASYADWKKESNKYGANAETMAANGLTGTGFSESSQVSMYNTYQNRVATARESYNQAILNYSNAIKDARLQNNAVLAEIAYEALQQQLELSLQGFQYKNQLILERADKKTEIENTYYARYLDVLDQINTENALAENARQFDASLAEEQRQFDASTASSSAAIEKEDEEETSDGDGILPRIFKAIFGGVTALKDNAGSGNSANDAFSGTTYKSAVDYMTSHGVSAVKAAAVMTETEWRRRKNAGSTSPHVKNYDSYAAYLNDYVTYCMEYGGE